jgi:hypothetical protein
MDEMDFRAVEEKVKRLRAQFAAGELPEAAFKAQLEELMIQDAEGHWWTLGYETGQWYCHDGEKWVARHPPGGQPAPTPGTQPVSAGGVAPAPHIPETRPAPPEPKPIPKPEPPSTYIRNPWRQLGFMAVVFIAALIHVLSLSGYVLWPLIPGGTWGCLLCLFPAVILGVVPPLLGILFGPWVSGLGISPALILIAVGAYYVDAADSPSFQALPYVLGLLLLGFFLVGYSVLPGLLVRNPNIWEWVAVIGALTYLPVLACVAAMGYGLSTMNDFPNSASGIAWGIFWAFAVAFIAYVVLFSFLPKALLVPVRKRGWYWRDARPRLG